MGIIGAFALGACDLPGQAELRNPAYARAVLSACRKAMASLPPPGPPIDSTLYGSEPPDPRYLQFAAVLESRTVRFDGPREGKTYWVADSRLPPEILELKPLYVIVTPDAVHLGLCGAGLSCSVNAVREGLGFDAVRHLRAGQPDCEGLTTGLWYCHE